MFRQIALLNIAVLLFSGCSYEVKNSAIKASDLQVEERNTVPLKLNDLALRNAEELRHDVTILGSFCSAYTYKMDLESDLIEELQSIDKDGSLRSPEVPNIQVIASSADSTVKCITTGLLSGKCQAKISFSGKIVSQTGKEEILNITKSSISSKPPCEGAMSSLKMASSDIVSEILTRVRLFGE